MNNYTTNDTNSTLLRYQTSAAALGILNICCFSSITVITAALLCWQRKHQLIRARNIGVAYFSLFCYFVIFVINSLFFAISPERGFPCWLHFTVFALGPLAIIGTVIKSWRLLFCMLLAKSKTELASNTCRNAQRTRHLIRVYTFLTSIPFLVLIMMVLLAIHGPIIVLNITILPYNNRCDIPNPVLQNLLFAEFVVPGLVYCILFAVMALILLVARLRDTWSIRCEIYLAPVYWFPLILVFGIMVANLDTIWPERYVPATLFCWIGGYIDVFINIWIPLARTMACTKRNSNEDLVATLKNRDLRNTFLQFTTRSFCPESLLFWIDVHENYVQQPQQAKYVFLQQVATKYLLASSTYELNLDARVRNEAVQVVHDALQSFAANNNHALEDDLLRRLIIHVEFDLCESFSRFKANKR